MLHAGLPLTTALDIVCGDRSAIVERIRNGDTFSSITRLHLMEYIPRQDISMVEIIRIGEETGTLVDSVKVVAQTSLREYRMRKRIQAAFLYPCLIAVGVLSLVLSLLIFVCPKIIPIFVGMKSLPFMTRVMISLSEYARNGYVWLSLFIFAVFGTALWLLPRFNPLKKQINKILASSLGYIPIISKLRSFLMRGRFYTMLGSMLDRGLSIERALTLYMGRDQRDDRNTIISQDIFYQEIESFRQYVSLGGDIGQSAFVLSETPEIRARIRVGSMTGGLSLAFKGIGSDYDRKVRENISTLTKSIEPGLMLILGGMVALIAVSLLLPLYSFTSHMGQ